MNFGQALEALKQDKRVERKGWNGKGMFLFLIKNDRWDFSCNRSEWNNIWGTIKSDFIAMKTADGHVVPWLASQTDMLAEDWEEVK